MWKKMAKQMQVAFSRQVCREWLIWLSKASWSTAQHSHQRSQCCTSIKWGAPTPFRNQRTVEGYLAWQVAQEVRSRWGRNVEEDGFDSQPF